MEGEFAGDPYRFCFNFCVRKESMDSWFKQKRDCAGKNFNDMYPGDVKKKKKEMMPQFAFF